MESKKPEPGPGTELLTFADMAGNADSPTAEDRAVIASLPADSQRTAASLILWYRNHPQCYRAFVDEARDMLRKRGAGLAPVHVAYNIRHPLRGNSPVTMGNCAATFLSRIVRLREPDLGRAFDLRDSCIADVIIAAGWNP